MLKGFNHPLTPKGKSTLNPAPPWYYSSDFLNIEFWADPSAVPATLPTGLAADPKAEGHANALFYDWQFSGSNEEYLDPARYQYREFFILLDATITYEEAKNFGLFMLTAVLSGRGDEIIDLAQVNLLR